MDDIRPARNSHSIPQRNETHTLCRIVFWNLNKKDLTDLVCDLAVATEADVLVLNECDVAIRTTLQALNTKGNQQFFVPESNSEDRFHCFSRNPALDLILQRYEGFH